MSNENKFKFCFNCNNNIPIITESNFYETEQNFEKNHENHLISILTGKEMITYEKRHCIVSKIRKNNTALRNLKIFIDEPTLMESALLNSIKDENRQLKKQLRQLKDETISFNDVLESQFGI